MGRHAFAAALVASFFAGAPIAAADDTKPPEASPQEATPVAGGASTGEAPTMGVPPPNPRLKAPPGDVKPEPGGISPVFFGVGLAATLGVSTAMLWSGIDTVNNPGVDAVRAACQGRGITCPLYQEGLASQTRTNVLIGATAGAAAVTVVLAVFTRWRDGRDDGKPPARVFAFDPVDHGALLRAAGVF